MPSPLVHGATGYLIYRISRSTSPADSKKPSWSLSWPIAGAVGLSLIPDLDAVPGVLFGDLGRFHNNFMNSMIVGLVVALGVGAAVGSSRRSGFWKWFAIGLVSYESHVLMDLFTIGRGLKLAWPLLPDRFEPPLKLFYGVRWSEGLLSWKHLLTLLSELGSLGIALLVLRRVGRR